MTKSLRPGRREPGTCSSKVSTEPCILEMSVNYFAIKDDGTVKGRGIFNRERPLQTNPHLEICADACVAWLKDRIPIEETIKREKNIRKFIMVRQVSGGAKWRGKHLGKVVRWIWSHDALAEPLLYVKNNNKVPQSDGAMPLMTLHAGTHQRLIDREKYITEAYKILKSIGGMP